jgi:hypothetical protein
MYVSPLPLNVALVALSLNPLDKMSISAPAPVESAVLGYKSLVEVLKVSLDVSRITQYLDAEVLLNNTNLGLNPR